MLRRVVQRLNRSVKKTLYVPERHSERVQQLRVVLYIDKRD